ncbi:MAG TPA: hypothetical protein PKO15_06010 [Fibrobacteria bacterium]|nr:hypothetical protein [Fibrobacteria bacterium]HOX51426.1 hypothetical protein [Fibrobacteria bacterium]
MNGSRVHGPFLAALIGFSSGEIPGSDTVFLSKQIQDGRLVGVYVDPDRGSRFYRNLTRFSMDGFDSITYGNSLDRLREQGLKLGKVKNSVPWTRWVALVEHQGGLYAYHPCDFLFHRAWSINDSTAIEWTGEGPFATKVQWQRRSGPGTFRIGYSGEAGSTAELTIRLVDRKKGIAVFQDVPPGGGDTTYSLMIAAETIRSVPLIVNRCPGGKRLEHSFDKPDPRKYLPR